MPTSRNRWMSLSRIATVGNSLPRHCGIATFTTDLTRALAAAAPETEVWSVAMNDRPEGYAYPAQVHFEINQNRLAEYRLAADYLNMSGAEVCCLQHEFGIFGGPAGSHVAELMRRLRMPIVTTLHTVLKNPEPAYRESLLQIAELSDRLVVMAERAFEFLTDLYGVPREKIALIPHGIPDVPFVDPNYYKDQFEVEGRKVILTFGLLSPNKGIENMIEALPAIVARHPEAVYLVLGATHPGVVAHNGETYRQGLQQRARQLGVEKHIRWFNRFVELEELIEFLGAADVYVTPYLNEAQITSGTLAYALGTGKATVSTPYWHAQELLAEGRGKLVPFADPKALSEAICDLFDNEVQRHAMRKRAYQYTRPFRWSQTAAMYLNLFQTVRHERARSPRPAVRRRHAGESGELPQVRLDHLRVLGDDVGVFRHARVNVPQRCGGYATDDNARTLVCLLFAQDHLQPAGKPRELDTLTSRQLSFLEDAFNPETGRFRNHLGFDRRWRKESGSEGSEESHGRALWALGETVARSQVSGHRTLGMLLFQQALPASEAFSSLHGMAYSLVGIHAYLRRFSGDSFARRVREHLADRLFEAFEKHGSSTWPWPCETLPHAAARIPHALLLSGRWMFADGMIQMALHSLEWLHGLQSNADGGFVPIGSERSMTRDQPRVRFDQKPIEVAVSIDAYLEAYRVTNEKVWLDRADRALRWFLGENDLSLPMYDRATGGCHDSLTAQGVNQNQGAEATLSWLLAALAMYEQHQDLETGSDSRIEPVPGETNPVLAAGTTTG